MRNARRLDRRAFVRAPGTQPFGFVAVLVAAGFAAGFVTEIACATV